MTPAKFSIAMNGSMLDDHPTGVGVYSINVINHLSSIYKESQQKKIVVFTPTSAVLQKHVETVIIPGVIKSSKYGKLAALSRFIWNTFYYPIRVRKFDLLISPTTHGSFATSNQVITIHDLISLKYNNISLHQRFYFKYLLPFLISKTKLIVTVSETTKNDIVDLLKCPAEKVKVIYNGYDHSIYFPAERNQYNVERVYGLKNYLLAIGPTYAHKNFELLLQAYKSLEAAVRIKYPLLIAGGKQPYLDKLKKTVQDLNLVHQVHFIGYVPIDLMPSLYREAHALIFPSLYEGFGIPLLEAMACGCPVATSNTSSMPEVCEEAAVYFNPADKNDMAKAIISISENKQLREKMITLGLTQVKKFSWKKTAEHLEDLIENIKSL